MDSDQNMTPVSQDNVEYAHRTFRKDTKDGMEGVCPYYLRDRGRGVVYCECARFHFPDRLARREILYTFCAHPEGYKRCVIKQAMDHYYERKYERIENSQSGQNGTCHGTSHI